MAKSLSNNIITGSLVATQPIQAVGTSYGFAIQSVAPVSTSYWKIATLPITGSGTFDHIVVDAVLDDNWSAINKTQISAVFGNRGEFSGRFTQHGSLRSNSRLVAYRESDGSVSIYFQLNAGGYTSFSYNISQSLGATIYHNPVSTTTAPTGTLVFDTFTSPKSMVIDPGRGMILNPAPEFVGLRVRGTTLTATVTNVVASAGTVTYTANNNFTAGQRVTVTGVNPTAYNLSSVIIATANATSFTVTNAATGTFVSGGTATVTQTGNLTEWQSFDSTVLASISAAGAAVFKQVRAADPIAAGAFAGQSGTYLSTQGWSNGHIGLLVRSTSGGSFNASVYQNSAGTVIGGRLDSGGIFTGSTNAIFSSTGGATTATSGTGTVATITTTSAHGISVGDTVTVAGVTPTGYNGTFNVTAITSNTVSYSNTTTGSQTVAGTISVPAQMSITSKSAGTKSIVLRSAASQVANPLEIQNSAGGVLSYVSPSGVNMSARFQTTGSEFAAAIVNGGGFAQLKKSTASALPGVLDFARLFVVAGTTANTLKLVIRAGASGVEEPLFDNIDQLGTGSVSLGSTVAVSPSQVTGTAVIDNDSRLSDSRTPTLHADSHAAGGSDPILGLVPTGSITMYAGLTAPSGWRVCDGTGFSSTEYPALAAVVGDTYALHVGTMYYLPDLRGRIGVGADDMGSGAAERNPDNSALGQYGGFATVALAATNLPTHTHSGTTSSDGAHTHTFSGTTPDGGSHSHTGTTDGDAHTHTVANRTIVPGGTAGNFFESWSSGGSTSRTHTTSSDSHTHTFTIGASGTHSHTYSGTTSGASTNHTHTFTTGGGSGLNATPVENRQPYLVVNYIIKT